MPPIIPTAVPPSGSDTAAAQAYYNYLYRQYLEAIPAHRTEILWSGPFWIALWAVVLIGFFYLYTRYASYTHRRHGALYGVSSFAGSILERIGPVSRFLRIVWAAIVLWALYFVVTHILFGQIY